MKKLSYLLLLILLSVSTIAQGKRLSGNWKEVSCTNAEGDILTIRDTIFLSFLEGNEYIWMLDGNPSRRGSYKVIQDTLDLGARKFTILKNSSKSLILTDGYFEYRFIPTEIKASLSVSEKLPTAVEDLNAILGTWKVFKRTSDATLKKIDYNTLLQKVVIVSGDTPPYGYITAASKPQEKDGWKIIKLENGVLYTEGSTQRNFELSLRDDELLVKEDGITYFLKIFNDN